MYATNCAKHLISIQLLLQCKVDLLYMGAVILFLFYPAGAFSVRSALALPRGGNFCFVIAGKQAVGFKKNCGKRDFNFQISAECGRKNGVPPREPLKSGGQTRNRTRDTRIFSPPLYQQSYLAI